MMSSELSVPPARISARAFRKPLLLGPGPCDVWPSVAEALVMPIMSPMDDEYFNVLDDIRAGLQYVFQTRSPLVLAMSGAGHAGMEAVLANLLAPGDTLLVATRGIWDERAMIMARRYGAKPVPHRVPMGSTFSLAELEAQVRRLRPAALFVTHGDSSTGSVQDLRGLGDMCHKYDTLLIVDTVVSLVGVPFLMDPWAVDAVYTSSQKALSGPAGITPVAFSARAEKKIKSRKHEPPFYFDIKLLAEQWNCYGNTRVYHHTLSPPLLWALRCCLREVCDETLPVSWARHAATTAHFHERIRQLDLQFLVTRPEDRLQTVTTLVLPEGYEYLKVVKYIKEKFNIQIFGGLGPTAGRALRIGLMGVNSTVAIADACADALAAALRDTKNSKL